MKRFVFLAIGWTAVACGDASTKVSETDPSSGVVTDADVSVELPVL